MQTDRTREGALRVKRGEGDWPRPRDLKVLRWTSEQYGARLDHMAALIERSHASARLTLIRLHSAGYVDMRRFVVGELPWMLPTWKGLALSHLSGRPWDPSLLRLAHVAAINEVRLHVQGRRPDVEWLSARRLRGQGQDGRGYLRNLPDGVALVEGLRLAIKVELHFRGERMPALFDELQRGHDATLCYCTAEALRELAPLAQSGRWDNLELRELPGVGSSAKGSRAQGSPAGGSTAEAPRREEG